MDIGASSAQAHRPTPDVLHGLHSSCRFMLHDRAAFDDRYLVALMEVLPARHPLRTAPKPALDLLDVVLRSVLSGVSPERTEAECRMLGEQGAALGLPDDSYPAVVHALVRAARTILGEGWSSTIGSSWAAVHLWVVGQLCAGAAWKRSQEAELPDPLLMTEPAQISAPTQLPEPTQFPAPTKLPQPAREENSRRRSSRTGPNPGAQETRIGRRLFRGRSGGMNP